MRKILVIESSARDAERLQTLLAREDVEMALCETGVEAERVFIGAAGFAAVFILWEIPGPPFGFRLLARCRQFWPETPVIVMSGMLDAALAARAFALGARDFLEKPLESERVKSCLRSVFAGQDPLSPLVAHLRQEIVGESLALLTTLKQVARVIPHSDSSVLLIGESGTGKELLAQATHHSGPRARKPWVAVNVGEIPATLIESALFGHEKGSFTGATELRKGFLEEAQDGVLFLDEIGDLDVTLQVKLLRAIQEKEFRRLGGTKALPFAARLVSATNRDLAAAVNQGAFRRDLFHRIAEVTIQVPPLRERKGDVDVLLSHFLELYRGDRQISLARETLTILRSYPFPGNVRELQNLLKAALIECEGETILPHHLPLRSMGAFLASEDGNAPATSLALKNESGRQYEELFLELRRSLPENWLELGHRDARQYYEQAFDRIYLRYLIERARYNVKRAAEAAGIDPKTLRRRWEECGLPPLRAGDEKSDE